MRCAGKDCDREAIARGFCKKHYERLNRNGDPNRLRIMPIGMQKGMKCIIPKCNSPAKYKGLCKKHYKRQWRHGDPTKTLINMERIPEPCKVENCVDYIRYPSTGMCHKHHLRWTRHGRTYTVVGEKGSGNINTDGYKVFRIDGRFYYEHIMVAEKALGKPLPKGAVVHHVNGVRSDNRPHNLVICPDQAYHMLLHKRQRDRDAAIRNSNLRMEDL